MRTAPIAARLVGLAVFAGLGGGCYRSTLLLEPPADASVASRLAAWQLEADGAPPLALGIYDTQEQAHCRFVPDEAGQLRCLPWPVTSLEDTGTFADPACQQRVYRTDHLAGQALVGRPTAVALPRASCAPQRYAVAILAARSVDAPLYAGTPCARVASSVDGPSELGVEATLPPDRWATGTEVDGAAISDRLTVRQIETADGARFDDHLADARWGAACALTNDEGGTACWPDTLADTPFGFEDTLCMGTPVWAVDTCEVPAFIGRSSHPFHAVGGPWHGVVFAGPKGCSPLLDGQGSFVELGAPLDGDAVVATTWQLAGTGRFQLRVLADAAGGPVSIADALEPPSETTRFRDTVAAVDCSPVATPDGLVRCVPTNVMIDASSGGLFADEACQRPAYFCLGGSPCAGRPAISLAVDANGERRAVSVAVAEAAESISFLFDGTCVPAGVDPTGLFALGAAGPWSQFPALTEAHGRASGAP
jgi:hypothetical protein